MRDLAPSGRQIVLQRRDAPRAHAGHRQMRHQSPMPDAVALTWRQYRLERHMFWRNPSAAFFNFALPLLFLAAGGVILHGKQHDLNLLVPAIAGMSVMSTTFTALAYNIVFLRERGVLKRIRGTPLPTISYFGGVAANAVTNTALADRDHHGRRQAVLRDRLAASSGSSWSCSWWPASSALPPLAWPLPM